jgi:CPA1 family monovalent cation:H+ antiporter
LLSRRVEETRQELEILRLQFPGYAEDLERRLIRRTTLQLEKREYDAFSDDGLIGLELQTELNAQIEGRRQRLNERPTLDLKQQHASIIDHFPALAELGERQRKALARGLRLIYAVPGQRLVRRELSGKDVWFIASGAVIVSFDDHKVRLSSGEMFGQVAALARQRQPVRVSAVGYCTLFSLSARKLLRLMKSEASIKRAVLQCTEKTGIKLTPGDFELDEHELAKKVRALMADNANKPAQTPVREARSLPPPDPASKLKPEA